MQALAAEMNLSETTFVLPPSDPANTARVRIFNRTAEMAFAGHPSIGTAYILSRLGLAQAELIRLEVPAGIVPVQLELRDGHAVGGRLTAPKPLELGQHYDAEELARCVGLHGSDIETGLHRPTLASMGNPYVIACVGDAALGKAVPDLMRFREFRASHPELGSRFSLFMYAGRGTELRARRFAPLAGTWEDPATGSANAPLAGLLLSCTGGDRAEYVVRQGVEMGRPSLLRLTAERSGEAITATVAGDCVPVLSGIARVRDGDEA
jgi:trans-2,3-dihydro-3-hydroxyanthranilate isomerase